ncbi:MAG: hypothetical protein AAF986_10780, partial [Pseudomonadota bacterium]
EGFDVNAGWREPSLLRFIDHLTYQFDKITLVSRFLFIVLQSNLLTPVMILLKLVSILNHDLICLVLISELIIPQVF